MNISNAAIQLPEGTLTRKGQITIPVEARRKLGLKPKDKVRFSLESGAVRLSRAPSSSLLETFGFVKPTKRPEDFKKLREEFERGVAENALREDS